MYESNEVSLSIAPLGVNSITLSPTDLANSKS